MQKHLIALKDVAWFDKDAIREQENSSTFYSAIWYRDGVIDPDRLWA